jgi:hypothetical protein
MATLPFSGTTILQGSSDQQSVTSIQQGLVAVNCGPVDAPGVFGPETFAAVEHFQARSVDSNGNPLIIDGKVGPSTWGVLFGTENVPTIAVTSSALLTEMLSVACSQVGVMEVPLNSNRGPQVDIYITTTGANPAENVPWCACFVYWCFNTAANNLSVSNPCFKTAGVLDHWSGAATVPGAQRILPAQAADQPSLIVPGMAFLIRTSGEHGHMGIVKEVRGNQLTTIEGNTNDSGSREGIGVFQHTARTIPQINLGFVLYP